MIGCTCSILRLNADDSLVANVGPHFSLFLPGALFGRALRGQSGLFEAEGSGSLGEVSMLGGAAGRDGWEAYEIVRLSAQSEASSSGLSFRISIEIGEADPSSFFSSEPADLRGRLYDIESLIPFENLGDFYYEHRSKPDWWAIVRRDVETHFGVTIPAESA